MRARRGHIVERQPLDRVGDPSRHLQLALCDLLVLLWRKALAVTRPPRCKESGCLRPAEYRGVFGGECRECYERRIARECRGITAKEQQMGEYSEQIGMRVRKKGKRK